MLRLRYGVLRASLASGKRAPASAMKFAAMFSSESITTRGKPLPVPARHAPKKRTMNLEKSFVTQTMSDNSVYVGEWSHGTMNGKGTLVYLNGNILEGLWFHGDLSGNVKITYKNGDTFEGVVSQNTITEGNGVWRVLSAEPSEFDYNGSWRNGMFDGFGTKKFEDGTVYKGEWKKNTRHGLGTCTFPDGTTFEGEFFADSREGVGRSCSPDGKVFLGVFSRNNIQSGRGYSVLSDGSTYDGEWAAGCKHGKGVHRLTDGSVYEGMWRKDQLHGPGKVISPLGEVTEGIYEAGVLIGPAGADIQPALHHNAGLQQKMKHSSSNAVIHAVSKLPAGQAVAQAPVKVIPLRATPTVSTVASVTDSVRMPSHAGASTTHMPAPTSNATATISTTFTATSSTTTTNAVNVSVASPIVDHSPKQTLADYKATVLSKLPAGSVTLTLPDGVYQGEARVNDTRRGYGVMSYNDGSVYIGKWYNNLYSGSGVLNNASGFYAGKWVEGKLHGEGRHTVFSIAEGGEKAAQKVHYEGDFEQGVRSGQGKLFVDDLLVYKGQFANDVYHGNGVQTGKDSVYTGCFENGARHGQGVLTYTSSPFAALKNQADVRAINPFVGTFDLPYTGTGCVMRPTGIYKGKLVEGKEEGHGKFTFFEDNKVIKGEWVNGELKRVTDTIIPAAKPAAPVVEATTPSSNASTISAIPATPPKITKPAKPVKTKPFNFTDRDCVYTGGMYNNQRHGHGTLTHSDGYTFQGEFLKGAMNGYGKWSHPRGDYLEGFYSDNQMNGQGSRLVEGVSFEGEFVNNVPHGYGVSREAGGASYEGDFEDGLYHGYGTYKQADGTVYSGEFELGQKQGTGVVTYPDGSRYQGPFQDDVRSGAGKITYANGNILVGKFVNDHIASGVYTYSQDPSNGGKAGSVEQWRSKEGKTTSNKKSKEDPHEAVASSVAPSATKPANVAVKAPVITSSKAVKAAKIRAPLDTSAFSNIHPTIDAAVAVLPVKSVTLTLSEGSYIGEVGAHNKRRGQGIMKYLDGSVYIGKWFEDKPSVYGFMTFMQNNQRVAIYKGGWADGVFNGGGKHKVFVYDPQDPTVLTDTVCYEGTFERGLRCGKGKLYKKDHLLYKGDFVNDQYHGEGILRENNTWYTGAFVNGQMHGEGVLNYTQELKPKYYYKKGVPAFRGTFAHNLPHTGTGGVLRGTGVYDGKLVEGKEEGHGKFTFFDENKVIEGEWVNGEITAGKQLDKKGNLIYEGELRNLQPCGHGTLHLPNNTTYTGRVEQNQPHGTGVLTYPNNKTFQGEFAQGKVLSGSGYYVMPNRDTYEGTIVNGLPQGSGVYTIPYKEVMKGEFVNGVLVKGRMEMNKGRAFYEGEWKDKLYHGHGELSNNTLHYIGQFSQGKMHGEGTVRFLTSTGRENFAAKPTNKHVKNAKTAEVEENENTDHAISTSDEDYHPPFTGEFKHGVPIEGSGFFIYPSYSYSGTIKGGKKDGEGAMYHLDGHYQRGIFQNDVLISGVAGKLDSSLQATGSFDKNGKLNGEGKIVMTDRRVLEGVFNQGQLKSPGKITYPDKSVYEGEHVRLVRDGQGKFTATNGSVYTGGFSKDAMHGDGVLTYTDGRTLQGNFQKGRLINGSGLLRLKDGGSYEGKLFE